MHVSINAVGNVDAHLFSSRYFLELKGKDASTHSCFNDRQHTVYWLNHLLYATVTRKSVDFPQLLH